MIPIPLLHHSISPHHSIPTPLHADRSDNATSLWSPLKQLSTGAPFALETGTRSNTLACGDGCDAQEFLQLHADVKRHR